MYGEPPSSPRCREAILWVRRLGRVPRPWRRRRPCVFPGKRGRPTVSQLAEGRRRGAAMSASELPVSKGRAQRDPRFAARWQQPVTSECSSRESQGRRPAVDVPTTPRRARARARDHRVIEWGKPKSVAGKKPRHPLRARRRPTKQTAANATPTRRLRWWRHTVVDIQTIPRRTGFLPCRLATRWR